jgi:hypothetical protein
MILLNINHPCYEVDIVELTNESDIESVKKQGYIELNELRKVVDLLRHVNDEFHSYSQIVIGLAHVIPPEDLHIRWHRHF